MGGSVVTIDHPEIILSSLRKHKDGFRMTLYNAADHENHGEITLVPLGKKISLDFKQYELQTIDL